jgi:hypothetical protein
MTRLAIVVTTFVAVIGCGQSLFAEEAIPERWVCSLSTGTDVLNAGRPIFSVSISAFVNERDSRIDSHTRTPQTLPGHHRSSSAADVRSTAYVVITRSSRMGVAFA